jgi:hypothetical protein
MRIFSVPQDFTLYAVQQTGTVTGAFALPFHIPDWVNAPSGAVGQIIALVGDGTAPRDVITVRTISVAQFANADLITCIATGATAIINFVTVPSPLRVPNPLASISSGATGTVAAVISGTGKFVEDRIRVDVTSAAKFDNFNLVVDTLMDTHWEITDVSIPIAFAVGDIITGETSGATAQISEIEGSGVSAGDKINFAQISGAFTEDERVAAPSGASAVIKLYR